LFGVTRQLTPNLPQPPIDPEIITNSRSMRKIDDAENRSVFPVGLGSTAV
jgi:hypothetical protein